MRLEAMPLVNCPDCDALLDVRSYGYEDGDIKRIWRECTCGRELEEWPCNELSEAQHKSNTISILEEALDSYTTAVAYILDVCTELHNLGLGLDADIQINRIESCAEIAGLEMLNTAEGRFLRELENGKVPGVQYASIGKDVNQNG